MNRAQVIALLRQGNQIIRIRSKSLLGRARDVWRIEPDHTHVTRKVAESLLNQTKLTHIRDSQLANKDTITYFEWA